jgi:hypothetical protein
MVSLTLTDDVAHGFIRALEDAGCQGYADMVRKSAGCADSRCIMEHN